MTEVDTACNEAQNSSGQSILTITNLKCEYPGKKSTIYLDSLDVKQGDCLLIKGKSGAGKSTLFYALKNLIPIAIPGKIQGNIACKEKMAIGLLMQNPDAQIVTGTVLEELAFSLENKEFPPELICEKINEYAEKFNIQHLLNKKTADLSGGEKQKINLLSVLLPEPEILLLDEPTAFLDPESAQLFMDTIYQIAHKKTMLIIEHNLHYLEKIVNRVLAINTQGIIEEIPIKNVQWHPCLIKKTARKNTSTQAILSVKKYITQGGEINNIKIFRQEIIGITGKNGVGKSTFLKFLSKINFHKNNHIDFMNQNICYIPWKKYYQQITVLMQNSENHFIFRTVKEEVPNMDILKTMHLQKQQEQNPFTLSEGQKRRLAIAIMWNLNRELYLMDEPTFGQDEENKKHLIDMMHKMNIQGKTFIIVSHDIPFLQAVCHRMLEFTHEGLKENVP